MHYTRAHAEMFSKLWPKVSGQVTSPCFTWSCQKRHNSGYSYIRQTVVTLLCTKQHQKRREGKGGGPMENEGARKVRNSQQKGKERRKRQLVQCLVAVTLGSSLTARGLGFPSMPLALPAIVKLVQVHHHSVRKKGSKLPGKNYRPRASLRRYSYSAGVWENALHALPV